MPLVPPYQKFFIGHVTPQVTEAALRDYFSSFAPVHLIKIEHAKAYAFVEFDRPVPEMVLGRDQHCISGVPIHVSLPKDSQDPKAQSAPAAPSFHSPKEIRKETAQKFFIGNVPQPESAAVGLVESHFSQFGPLNDVRVNIDRNGSIYAHVVFERPVTIDVGDYSHSFGGRSVNVHVAHALSYGTRDVRRWAEAGIPDVVIPPRSGPASGGGGRRDATADPTAMRKRLRSRSRSRSPPGYHSSNDRRRRDDDSRERGERRHEGNDRDRRGGQDESRRRQGNDDQVTLPPFRPERTYTKDPPPPTARHNAPATQPHPNSLPPPDYHRPHSGEEAAARYQAALPPPPPPPPLPPSIAHHHHHQQQQHHPAPPQQQHPPAAFSGAPPPPPSPPSGVMWLFPLDAVPAALVAEGRGTLVQVSHTGVQVIQAATKR